MYGEIRGKSDRIDRRAQAANDERAAIILYVNWLTGRRSRTLGDDDLYVVAYSGVTSSVAIIVS